MSVSIAFGLTAGRGSDSERIGAVLEHLGYDEAWVNDTRRGDGIATVAALAAGSARLRLGVGVVALSEHEPAAIAARVAAAGLPADRFTLGVGSGSSASLDLVRYGVRDLRGLVPGVAIAVAAVGPRMARLAGEVGDAVVANWALPDRLAWLRERIAEGAAAAGRRPPRLAAYVRTAVGAGAAERLRKEMERYRSYGGGHYARSFDAQPAGLVGVAAADSGDARRQLRAYLGAADTIVVRALPVRDEVDAWLAVAEALAGFSAGESRSS